MIGFRTSLCASRPDGPTAATSFGRRAGPSGFRT